MKLLERTDVDEVVETWVRAEMESSRFGGRLSELLASDGHDRSALADPMVRLRLLSRLRGHGAEPDPTNPLIEGLALGKLAWWRTELDRADLPDIRYIDWDFWLEVTDGSRLPLDYVRRLEGDATRPSEAVDEVVEDIRRGVRLAPMILVDSGPGTRLVVAEGHLRLTAYLMARAATPEPLLVLLGRAPEVAAWSDY